MRPAGQIKTTAEALRLFAESLCDRDEVAIEATCNTHAIARLLERRCDDKLDRPIAESMTSRPLTVGAGALLVDAIETLSANRISELPVVDDAGRPVGLLDITDVVALVPSAQSKARAAA